MGYNMNKSIKLFKTNFVLFFVLISLGFSSCTNTSTVCFGAPGIPCTEHRLSCPSPLVIQIINTTYGYRLGCNNDIGITTCSNTTCCNEEPGDCFLPFSSEDDQQVARNCSGQINCEMRAFRRYDIRQTVCSNGSVVSSYSKIQYDCVSKGLTVTTEMRTQTSEESTHKAQYSTDQTVFMSSTTQYSTDKAVTTSSATQCPVVQCDNSSVVGGVLGTLLIISVCVNVGMAVYLTRKIKSLSSTPRENNYDGLTNTGRDQPLPTYDDLQVQSTASSNHNDKKKSDRPNSHTYYNTKGDCLSRNIDPYYENMKKP